MAPNASAPMRIGTGSSDEAPTGFMVIKREVFLAVAKHYPPLNYAPDGPAGYPQTHLHWRFFDTVVVSQSGRYLCQDYAFCQLWRAMGGKVWTDLNCPLVYHDQIDYRGNLVESLHAQRHM